MWAELETKKGELTVGGDMEQLADGVAEVESWRATEEVESYRRGGATGTMVT